MEENMNYIFNETVGNVKCKFDGKLWTFDDASLMFDTDTTVIPVKSISMVQLIKVMSWKWLILLLFALVFAVVGWILDSGEMQGEWIFYSLAILLVIIAVVVLFFSRQYSISVITHSGCEQSIITRRRSNLTKLYEELINSLRVNL